MHGTTPLKPSEIHIGRPVVRFLPSDGKIRTDALPDGQTAAPMKLTQGKLHVEQGQPAKQQHNAVRDEKRTTAILIADVRKSPNIAQIHRKPNHRQQKLRLLAPGLTPSFTGQCHHKATLLATLQNLCCLGGGRCIE
uniref:Uncharacterized protein n=1 Tax=Anopheles merus TaxID=30066 RepID=A0A182VDC8_ANOME